MASWLVESFDGGDGGERDAPLAATEARLDGNGRRTRSSVSQLCSWVSRTWHATLKCGAGRLTSPGAFGVPCKLGKRLFELADSKPPRSPCLVGPASNGQVQRHRQREVGRQTPCRHQQQGQLGCASAPSRSSLILPRPSSPPPLSLRARLRVCSPTFPFASLQSNKVRGKASSNDELLGREARPLSSLRDPNSFAPPPRRTGNGLAPAPPPTKEKRQVITAPSKYQDPRAPRVEPPPQRLAASEPEPQQLEAAPQSHAYRTNTSGLRTDHLPPPPGRRDGADGRAPPSYDLATGAVGRAANPSPRLPPRLPPRSGSDSSTSSPRATGQERPGNGVLNQGAVDRLGAAGMSVPGLGIAPSSGAAHPSSRGGPPPPPRRQESGSGAQVSKMQDRLSSMSMSPGNGNPPAEGTSWRQKQAALETASAFRKDPSSVSLSDARSAASTANNFRQRHGDQVAFGMQKASSLDQKWGVTGRIGSYPASQTQQDGNACSGHQRGSSAQAALAAAAKKKAPPPPKKNPQLLGPSSPVPADHPPPVPNATRPT